MKSAKAFRYILSFPPLAGSAWFLSELNEADYDALVIRFSNNQDLPSVGNAMGIRMLSEQVREPKVRKRYVCEEG